MFIYMCIWNPKYYSISIDKSIRTNPCKVLQIVGLHRFGGERFKIFEVVDLGTFHWLALTNDMAQQRIFEVFLLLRREVESC